MLTARTSRGPFTASSAGRPRGCGPPISSSRARRPTILLVFVLGVQVHPEELVGHSEPARRLFSALAVAARKSSTPPPRCRSWGACATATSLPGRRRCTPCSPSRRLLLPPDWSWGSPVATLRQAEESLERLGSREMDLDARAWDGTPGGKYLKLYEPTRGSDPETFEDAVAALRCSLTRTSAPRAPILTSWALAGRERASLERAAFIIEAWENTDTGAGAQYRALPRRRLSRGAVAPGCDRDGGGDPSRAAGAHRRRHRHPGRAASRPRGRRPDAPG